MSTTKLKLTALPLILISTLCFSLVQARLSNNNKEQDTPADLNKVLIIVGKATETIDTFYPFFRVQEDGFMPVVASPEKRRYHMVLHEIPPDWNGRVTREFEGYTIQANIAFKDVNPEEYVGIFFSGGRAPEYIRYDKDLVRITRHFFEKNKSIACVCHNVEIPAYAGCVKGRRMATVGKCKFDLEVCGGIFVNEACVVDGNLVSGRTFHDHGKYMGVWIKMLRQARDESAKSKFPRSYGRDIFRYELKLARLCRMLPSTGLRP